MTVKLSILLLYLYGSAICFSSIVVIDQGKLSGTSYTLPNGRVINAFFGIPYAAPPVYELRFKVFRIFCYLLIFYYGMLMRIIYFIGT